MIVRKCRFGILALYVTVANIKILVVSFYVAPAQSKYALNYGELNQMFTAFSKLKSKRDGLIFYGDKVSRLKIQRRTF